jgi:hypothetical protein
VTRLNLSLRSTPASNALRPFVILPALKKMSLSVSTRRPAPDIPTKRNALAAGNVSQLAYTDHQEEK